MPAIIFGMPATGKTTVAKRLVEISKGELTRGITCTTRPPRPGEKDGEDYFFLTPEEMHARISNGYFFETKYYDTAEGVWIYGTPLDLLQRDDVILILSPDRVWEIMDTPAYWALRQNCRFYFLDATDSKITKRMIERGDEGAEIIRRVSADRRILDAQYGAMKDQATLYLRNRPIEEMADSIWKVESLVKRVKNQVSQEKRLT